MHGQGLRDGFDDQKSADRRLNMSQGLLPTGLVT